jgi:hypothetical protein
MPTASPTAAPTPSATPTAQPSPSPTATSIADNPNTLCVVGQRYTKTDFDDFDRDLTVNMADPIGAGPANANWDNGTLAGKLTDTLQWGQANNDYSDQSVNPTIAQIATMGLPAPWTINPGVGVTLTAYPLPTPTTAAEHTVACGDGVCRSYISGLLADPTPITNAYVLFTAQAPNGTGWWPALWMLSNGDADEADVMEGNQLWWGADVVEQTIHQSSGASYTSITVPTLSTAFHKYAVLLTASNVGFFVDGVGQSNFARSNTVPMNIMMNTQVCMTGSKSFCNAAPPNGSSATMTVKNYAVYTPPATPAPCSPNDVNTP